MYLNQPATRICRIDQYSHHFTVSAFSIDLRSILITFSKNMGEYGLVRVGRGKFIKQIVRVYAARDKSKTCYRFHITQYDEFIRYSSNWGVPTKQFEVYRHPMYLPLNVDYTYVDNRTPFDYQLPIIDYVIEPGPTKIVTLDPGRGKTFIALKSINAMACRAFFIIKPMYIDKWISDAKEAFKLDPGELVTVKGAEQLKNLMEANNSGDLIAKIIFCSNRTFNDYIKHYEHYGEDLKDLGYLYTPPELFERLGVGLKAVDEVHQEFHGNFKQDLYTHVPKTLSLSGTLISENPTLERMFNVMFPEELRFNDNARKVYMGVEALFYNCSDVEKRIKYMNTALKSYSHVLFEKSVLNNKQLLADYTSIIADITIKRFSDIRLKGQKLLVYCSTVLMCTHMTDYLKRVHNTLNVVRYVSEDDYEDMLEGDLIVSTLKSLGTAIDVPGLRVVLLTDALSSLQANLQSAGRLRELKQWPETTPEFLYLVCKDIPKHLDYHEKKKDIFRNRVVYHRETQTGYRI